MSKITSSFLLLAYSLTYFNCQIDFAWDQKLRLKDNDFKCGIENKFIQQSSARIINGKRTTNIRYPWMADILLVVRKISINDDIFKQYHGTGSIISDKAILTAAHVLCLGPYKDDGTPQEVVTCLKSNKGDKNQNRPENHVHYSIGSMGVIHKEMKFDKDIKAYMYKYEPKFWDEGTDAEKKNRRSKYKNGDVGLIINKSILGLNLKQYMAIPICLPSPEVFKEELKVTLVGRGNNYEYSKDDPSFNTCVTNGERVGSEITADSHSLFNFRSCRNYDRAKRENSCLNFDNARVKSKDGKSYYKGYYKHFISTKMKIYFVPNVQPRPKYFMQIDIPKNDLCEDLSDKAYEELMKAVHEKKIKILNDDEMGPSRIVVFDKNEKASNFIQELQYKLQYLRWEKQPSRSNAYCYNIKTVASYGVCETVYLSNKENNYGFCGSSCMTLNIWSFFEDTRTWSTFHGYQWEMKATYHETKTTVDFGNFLIYQGIY